MKDMNGRKWRRGGSALLIVGVIGMVFVGVRSVDRSSETAFRQMGGSVVEQEPAQELPARERRIRPGVASRPIPDPTTRRRETNPDPLARSLPSKEQLRQEVKRDPHGTPPSLLQLGRALGVRSERARQNPEAAAAFFSELEDCATNDASPDTARALCVTHARRIGQQRPELSSRLEALRGKVPVRVRQLSDATDRLKS